MGNPVKQIVISGYYGFRNSGDEAVLQSILSALEAEGKAAAVTIEPVVLSIDPELTSRMYGVKAVHRMKPKEVWTALRGCDGLISGGGSLLQDATGWKTIPYYLAVLKLAQWLKKPTFIYAQGLGPVNRSIFFNPIVSTFTRCAYVSVRDKESANLLAKMGYTKDVEVVPDPVMGLPLREHDLLSGKGEAGGAGNAAEGPAVIGVSVRNWNKDGSDLKGIARSLELVAAEYPRGLALRFLPFHPPGDAEASGEVIRQLKAAGVNGEISLVSDVEHPQAMLGEVASCDLLIGMRLHSLIYGASQEVPVVAISYDPKIDQFMRRLDASAVSSTAELDARAVADEVLRLLGAGPEWHSARAKRIHNLKQEARRPAQQIIAQLR
ncbi:MAG: csaB [Paenibacillaceae bacterium]|nr:csaB [Paenibacillaceae bacterium]